MDTKKIKILKPLSVGREKDQEGDLSASRQTETRGFFMPFIVRYPIDKKRFCQEANPSNFSHETVFSCILPAILLLLICFPNIVSADTDIFISEIQIAGEKANDEFIEFYNPTETTFSLDGLKICRKTSTGSLSQIKSFSSKDHIPRKGYFLFAHSESIFASLPADATTKSSPLSVNNSVALVDSCDSQNPPRHIVDSVAWGSGQPFDNNTFLYANTIPASKSLARNIDTLTWSLNDTPTPTNSDGQTFLSSPPILPEPNPPAGSHSIRINELLPNPEGSDTAKEWVEIFNFGSDTIHLTHWKLITTSGSSVNLTGDISGNNFLLISLALRNTSDTVSLFDPSTTIESAISYEHAPSGASLNYGKNGYRWSRTITPNAENILNNPPETKENIPDTAYLDVPVSFSASGKDTDGDTIKYTWDFGDGHKSYKQETMHRYEKEGVYSGTLTITDGTESIVTTFTITVERYKAPKIRMIALLPNPAGRDTNAEYITLENRSKKSVDLIGWSIATGWKKLINHPIRESFVIAKKSARNITHTFSAFTLPNEKGRIELRSPDGETVQQLKYNLKGTSAKDDARLVKEKGRKWEWILNQLTGSGQQIASQGAVAPFAGDASAVIDPQEEQLKRDTETISLKKRHGEKLLSITKDSTEEMRRLIGFGTNIETPVTTLDPTPRIAGANNEIPRPRQIETDDGFDFNAIINDWLSSE